jgi:hypothetical protein
MGLVDQKAIVFNGQVVDLFDARGVQPPALDGNAAQQPGLAFDH